MLKNATPRQLAFFAAFGISIAFIILATAILFLFQRSFDLQLIGATSLLVGLLSYVVFYYILKIYIYRKVKLVYKNIHRLKLTGAEKPNSTDINMNEDIISQVQSEVKNWADFQEEEIAQLKSMENYRRNFVGNVSHELKTPLFTVQGYIHTLLEGGLYDEKINMSFLQKAARGVNRLQSIVEDLDIITGLESGTLGIKFREFSIKTLVEEVFEEVEFFAGEREISLEFKDDTDADFVVSADREKINQVLINLIMNSIKYGKEKGQTKVSFYDMDKHVLVEVADNGIGISPEHLSHVFDRFYRVDSSGSRITGGSGLGLSIVKHILESHRQTVNVRSRKGLGSTFGFTLKKVK